MALTHDVSSQLFSWEDDQLVEPNESVGAAYSPEEAFTAALLELPKPEGERDRWFRHRWRRTLISPTPRFHQVAVAAGTIGPRVVQYLNTISSASNSTGTCPIFLKRETIARRMGVSIRTVDRCRVAAIRLGYHTQGHQLRWIDEDKPGTDPWCGGPSVLLLLMPDKKTLGISAKAAKAAERIATRKKAAVQRASLEGGAAAKRASLEAALERKAGERAALERKAERERKNAEYAERVSSERNPDSEELSSSDWIQQARAILHGLGAKSVE